MSLLLLGVARLRVLWHIPEPRSHIRVVGTVGSEMLFSPGPSGEGPGIA